VIKIKIEKQVVWPGTTC